MLDWSIISAALVAALPGLLALLISWKKVRSERGKTDADAAKSIVDAAGGVVVFKEKQVADLIERVRILEEGETLHEKRIEALERGIRTLSKQLSDAGLTPAWTMQEA